MDLFSVINSSGRYIVAMLPLILAGITNMVFVKLPILSFLSVPMDKGKILKDGKRLFGDNKTWKGFVGMIISTSFWFLVMSIISQTNVWFETMSFFPFSTYNTPFQELWYGAVWGVGYVLFELPNSYLKRRLDIAAGMAGRGMLGQLFAFVDQADSVLGCIVFMCFFYSPTLSDMLYLFVVGTGMHLLINVLLFVAGLKKKY